MHLKVGFVLLSLIGGLASHPGLAQEPGAAPGMEESAPRLPTLAPVELEAFVDGYMASYLDEAHIAGATVAVIEGEDTIFSKGYGVSDVEAGAPVDPETTLFRIGSVSKLFVWTSVMQLVEQGKLDLDADLNDYLTDLEIPEAFGAPVTMAELMTHSAGFDERVLGLFAADPSSLRPLGDILRDELPERVRPAGELTSYSNHGTGLAMHVVEQVSGMPWEDYIQKNILEPLGLRSTSFTQPLPDRLSSRMSKGYKFTDGAFVEAPFEFVPLAPVGAVASSALDMARFMAAHLGLGRLGDVRILDEATARRMQTTLFRHHRGVNGMAYGFIEMEWNGQRIIGHGGDTELFHTLFAFFPEQNIGLFASFNTVGADYIQLLKAFVDWRFPFDEGGAQATDATDRLERFAGTYRPTRYPHRSIAKIAALVSTFEVKAEGERLVIPGPRKRYFRRIGPLLFRQEGTSATLAFRESDDGRLTHLFLSEVPVIAFEPAPRIEQPSFVYALVGACLSIAILVILFWPVSALVRRHYHATLASERRVPAGARWSAWLGSLALVGSTFGLASALSDPMQVVYGLTPGVQSLFWLPLGAALFTAIALVGAIQAWRRGRGTFLGRSTFSVAVLAMVAYLWQLGVWNMLGFNY